MVDLAVQMYNLFPYAPMPNEPVIKIMVSTAGAMYRNTK